MASLVGVRACHCVGVFGGRLAYVTIFAWLLIYLCAIGNMVFVIGVVSLLLINDRQRHLPLGPGWSWGGGVGPNLAEASQPIPLPPFCEKSKVWAFANFVEIPDCA